MQLQLRSAGLAAGLLTLALAAPAVAAPSNVTVRIEGAANSLVEEGGFTTTTTPVNKGGKGDCSGTSAAGALERATGGDRDGTYYGTSVFFFVDTMTTEM